MKITTRRMLGRTGLEVSPISLGGAALTKCESDAAASDVCAAWLRGGVNFVDVAPGYGAGEAERRLGLALANVPRESYVLQTKIGDEGPHNGGFSPFSREGVLASVQNSLTVLKVPWIDCLLLHDPYEDEIDTFLSKGGGIEAVRELRSAGVVKHFGCGAREHEPHLRLLQTLGDEEFEVAMTVDDENPLRHFLDQLGLREALRRHGVGLINAAPLYRGLLVDRPTAYHSVGGDTDAEAARKAPAHTGVLGEHSGSHPELAALATSMLEWARQRELPLLHLAVQWPLQQADIVTSPFGCTTVEQVEGILRHASEPLPSGTFAAFDDAFGERVAALPPDKHFYWVCQQLLTPRHGPSYLRCLRPARSPRGHRIATVLRSSRSNQRAHVSGRRWLCIRAPRGRTPSWSRRRHPQAELGELRILPPYVCVLVCIICNDRVGVDRLGISNLPRDAL